jgi:hypothetical protein
MSSSRSESVDLTNSVEFCKHFTADFGEAVILLGAWFSESTAPSETGPSLPELSLFEKRLGWLEEHIYLLEFVSHLIDESFSRHLFGIAGNVAYLPLLFRWKFSLSWGFEVMVCFVWDENVSSVLLVSVISVESDFTVITVDVLCDVDVAVIFFTSFPFTFWCFGPNVPDCTFLIIRARLPHLKKYSQVH